MSDETRALAERGRYWKDRAEKAEAEGATAVVLLERAAEEIRRLRETLVAIETLMIEVDEDTDEESLTLIAKVLGNRETRSTAANPEEKT